MFWQMGSLRALKPECYRLEKPTTLACLPGLLTIGPRFGGALDDAAKMLHGLQHCALCVATIVTATCDFPAWKPSRFAEAHDSGISAKDRHSPRAKV